jgi:hypothetical protein
MKEEVFHTFCFNSWLLPSFVEGSSSTPAPCGTDGCAERESGAEGREGEGEERQGTPRGDRLFWGFPLFVEGFD